MEALHPYAPPEESLALVERAAAIARDVAAPSAEDVDRRGRFPREALAALAEAGFYGLGVAPHAGGVGGDMRTLCAVVEILAEACASTAMIFVMHALAVRAIAASETLAGKDPLLREIASGRTLVTLAYSEETSRSNFWIQGSELERHDDGGYRLDALKTWVTSAGHAELYVAAARSPGATSGTEFTVFLARHAPSVEVLGSYDGLGLRGNASCKVRFREHRIGSADLLSEHGRGREFSGKILVPCFDVATAAMANGLCRAAVAATATHLASTTLNAGKLRDLPTLRSRLAEMAVRTDQSRALLGQALAHLEAPSPAAKVALLGARWAAINAAVEVTDLAMKAGGGAAFRKEGPVERLFRDARAGWVMAPTSDVLAEMIGRELTGLEPL